MPCTTNSAHARHTPVNSCPTPGLCCDSSTSFSSQQVCCGENYDQDWTPYDLRITADTTNPIYTLNQDSLSEFKVVGKSLFIKFHIEIDTVTSVGTGTYRLSLPSGFTFKLSDPFTDIGTVAFLQNSNAVLLQDANANTLFVQLSNGTEWSNVTLPALVSDLILVGDIQLRLA